MKENLRGCSEAEDVPQQHAVPSCAVEGDRGPDRDLRQSGLPGPAPAAHRLPVLRPVRPARRPPSGPRSLILRVSATTGKTPPSFTSLIEELGIHLDADLLDLALTHRSFAYENGHLPTNERLEFLGDSVLGVIVTEYLYRSYPDLPEGQLAKLRANVVSAVSLAQVARKLQIGPMIKLGHGEIGTGGQRKTSILADTMEALIGAVYLSSGKPAAELLVHHLFDPLVNHAATLGAGLDWKTSLQEVASALGLPTTVYEITESGPDHDKRFDAWAVLGTRRFGPGHGQNKKQAEQQAAAAAFKALDAEHSGDA